MSQLRLLFDARCVRAARSGVGYYAEGMLHAMNSALFAESTTSALVLEHEQGQIDGIRNITPLPVSADYERHPSGEWFEHVTLPRIAQQMGANCLWGPAFQVPWRRTRARRIVTVHDLMVFTHRYFFPRRFAWYMRQIIRRSVASADVVLCVSETVAGELKRMFPSLPPEKVRVAYTAVVPFGEPGGKAIEEVLESNPGTG